MKHRGRGAWLIPGPGLLNMIASLLSEVAVLPGSAMNTQILY